jgi:hypothetical protein
MVRERKDILVGRSPMQTRSNVKLRSYKLFGEGSTRRKLIRVLGFRKKIIRPSFNILTRLKLRSYKLFGT